MFARWRDKKRSSKNGEKVGNLKVLERKTADIRDKLARLSLGSTFRRHSAPAQSSQSHDNEDSCTHYGCRPERSVTDPLVLSQLPAPVLEMMLEHLSLKVRSRSLCKSDCICSASLSLSTGLCSAYRLPALLVTCARRVGLACSTKKT